MGSKNDIEKSLKDLKYFDEINFESDNFKRKKINVYFNDDRKKYVIYSGMYNKYLKTKKQLINKLYELLNGK